MRGEPDWDMGKFCIAIDEYNSWWEWKPSQREFIVHNRWARRRVTKLKFFTPCSCESDLNLICFRHFCALSLRSMKSFTTPIQFQIESFIWSTFLLLMKNWHSTPPAVHRTLMLLEKLSQNFSIETCTRVFPW